MRKSPVILFVVFSVAGGCGRSRSESSTPPPSATVPTTETATRDGSAASSTAKSACPRTGLWATCSLEKRLGQSGFVVRPGDQDIPHRAGFSVPPKAYLLGRSRLEVFIYPSQQAAGRDLAALDTLTAAPRGSIGVWRMQPTFVRSANLLAVFLTDSPVQGERLGLAITAGPPQP